MSKLFIDVREIVLSMHAARLIRRERSGEISLQVDEFETHVRNSSNRVCPARDRLHMQLSGLGFRRGANGRYFIEAADFNALRGEQVGA